jgi:signal transduction histidine kinase
MTGLRKTKSEDPTNSETCTNLWWEDQPSLYDALFDGSPLPMAIVMGATHILCYANPSFCLLIAKNKADLVGSRFAKLAPQGELLSLLDRVFQTGAAENHAEPEQSQTDTPYWSCAMWPVLGAGERPAGVMIQVTETARFHRRATAMNQELLLSGVRLHELADVAEKLNVQLQLEIAERKRMEQALLNSEKLAATARLASTMSHEINNPLGAITNLVYLLAPLQSSPEAQGYIATLEEEVKGLGRISTQMLKFHRDNNRPTEFKFEELLHEILHFYRPQAETLGIHLDHRIETEGKIVGFRGEVNQLVTNLLLNALEATPSGGKVRIHLYPAPPWRCEIHNRCGFCLSIADTGTGIAPQNYGRIFEPFFTTKGEKGTGLGLWLCTSIVNRVGGSIRVWSSCLPGRSGTCFSVFLPVDEAAFIPLRRRYERENSTCHKEE